MPVSIPIWCDYKTVQATRVSASLRFQFQYGAIISFIYIFILHMVIIVSIPIWCDYKIGAFSISAGSLLVSIPIWCDYKQSSRYFQKLAWEVSIPIWCDYKRLCTRHIIRLSLFQFQYGAIISLSELYSDILEFRFNSNMVRL